jgi:uncharacterized protein (TIGR02266 family)
MWGRRRRKNPDDAGSGSERDLREVERARPSRQRALRHNVNLRFTYDFDGREWQAFSRDLSRSGVFLKTDHHLPLGARLRLRFNIPGELDAVCCEGSVRRSMPLDPRNVNAAGFAVEFDGLAERDAKRLEEFVRRHAPRRLFGQMLG